MLNLLVEAGKTFFDVDAKRGRGVWELEQMFKALRVKDKNAFWKYKAALKRHAFFSGYSEETKQERMEELQQETQWVKFYDRRSDSFHTGLLPRVIKRLKKRSVKYQITDLRKPLPKFKPIKKFHFVDKVENRPEQIVITNEALEKGRGIIHAATNAGKTEIACGIIAEFQKQFGRCPRVLFLIHRATLVEQTMERFKKHLGDRAAITMVGAGKRTVPRKGVLVATVQTASNLLDTAPFRKFQAACDILFIDEFHLNKAWQCSRIAAVCAAPMRFGLSGTIDTKNRIKYFHYKGMCGPIIASVRNEELVRLGRSAKPIINFVEVHAPKIPKSVGYRQAYLLGVVENQPRNRSVVKRTLRYLKRNLRVLITVARIKHGLNLKRKLEKKIDLPVAFLSGSSSLEERNRVIKSFERKKIAVLIASPIFDTGVDIPAIEGWVNAAAGVGWELVLQRLGRVLRKKKGDNRVWITDYMDVHNDYLLDHSLKRLQYYQEEKIAEVTISDAHA